MIIIYNGDRQIFHPQNPNLKLISPKLILEDNAAGSLTFKIYSSNLNYSTIRKLYPVISVVRDRKTLFKGRVISDKKDFYNGKSVEVEGKLAFFNDSYMEPFSFSGSPEELFRMVVENHNSQVMEWQRFKVGIVTVVDPNDYIVRSSENTINSWNALKDKCFKSSLGGHIRIRYEDDGDYIDWLADYEVISKQSIEFAKNMIDISSEVDATETYTAIRPIGAEVEGVKVDISSVNDGKTYLINEEKAAEYGIIYAPENESTWGDVTIPQNLLKKAEEKLFGSFVTLKETYEIKAVDLNLTDDTIEALNVCEYVPVISKPHGIKGNYLISKANICITEPQNSIFYLGSSKRVFSDMNSGGAAATPKNVSSFFNDAGYISEEKTEKILSDYTRTEVVEEMINQTIAQIPSGENGLSAYEIAVIYGFSGTEEEWVESLKGKDGAIPEIGENGNWYINGTDSGIKAKGIDGKDGVSPTITENAGNTSEVYKLDIITGSESYTTPNLKGTGSSGSAGLFGFEIREDGHLWMMTDNPVLADKFYINEDNGHLMYRLEQQQMDLDLGKVRWTDAEIEAKIEELGGGGGGFDVLWTNPNSLVANFAAQTIAVENILQYRFYEVIANVTNYSYLNTASTGKVPIYAVAFLQYDEGVAYLYRRISAPTEAGVYVANATRGRHDSVSSATVNNMLVPYMILGYK